MDNIAPAAPIATAPAPPVPAAPVPAPPMKMEEGGDTNGFPKIEFEFGDPATKINWAALIIMSFAMATMYMKFRFYRLKIEQLPAGK